MSVKIKIPTKEGITLHTKNKYVKDNISIVLDKSVFIVEDELVTRTATTYTNDRIIKIGDNALRQWSGLTSVSFPNAEKIGSLALYSCSDLVSVDFPNVTTIADQAFYGCSNLTKLDLPNLVSISGQVFRACSKLEIIYIPKIETITGAAFAYCTSIKALIIEQTESITTLNASTCFNGSGVANGTGFIYVPDTLVDSYKSATNWSTYANQIKPLSELPQEIKDELGM